MRWADYSGGRPTAAALKAAGFGGVIRYIGLGSEGKQINAAEYRDHVAHGMQVLLVGELGTGDAWGTETDDDFARGVAYAKASLADARAQGIPDSVGIACAADAHAATYQIDDVLRYARGFESVIGRARTGFYGFSETLTAVHAAGIGSWYWRCGSEPTADEKTWTHFWQRNAAPTVAIVSGVQCDINEQYNPITANTQEGNDMQLTDIVQAPDGTKLPYGQMLAEDYANLWTLRNNMDTQNAQLAGLAAAIGALSTDPGITADAITQIVRDAVRDNIQITGTVQIGAAKTEGTKL